MNKQMNIIDALWNFTAKLYKIRVLVHMHVTEDFIENPPNGFQDGSSMNNIQLVINYNIMMR